jgi:hypothetical protein
MTSMDIVAIGKKIETLTKQQHIDILRILVNHDVILNENKNGTFVNLSVLNKKTVDDIKEHLQHITAQEDQLKESETTKDAYNKEFFSETV